MFAKRKRVDYVPRTVSQVALRPSFELIVNSIEGYCNFGVLEGALTKNRLFVSAVVPLFAGQVGFF